MKYVWALIGRIDWEGSEPLEFFDHKPTKDEQLEAAGKQVIKYDDYLTIRYPVKSRKAKSNARQNASRSTSKSRRRV